MTDKTTTKQGRKPLPAEKTQSPEKKKKLASALRDNLKRRKASPRPDRPVHNPS